MKRYTKKAYKTYCEKRGFEYSETAFETIEKLQAWFDKNPGKVITIKEFEKITKIRICTNHTAKMAGMFSLSTSCINNKYCNAYRTISDRIELFNGRKLICGSCFAAAMFHFKANMVDKYMTNTEVLSTVLIPAELWPVLNVLNFRIESFGDLNNRIQAANYLNLITRNKQTNFGWWTKNPAFIQYCLDHGFKKPSNVNIGYSDPFINGYETFTDIIVKRFSWLDFIFTVYDKQYIKQHNIVINCGALQCLSCLKCYRQHKKDHEIIRIREQLK